MFYMYILQSGEELYIGYTANLKRRLAEHNAGQNFSTQSKQWKVLYYEAHTAASDAKRRERYFKTSTGRQSMKRMVHDALERQKNFAYARSTSGLQKDEK